MDKKVFESTKLVAYFLWEYTNCSNALFLWNCAEDIIKYFKSEAVFDSQDIQKIICLPPVSSDYINFMRNIAFRIFIYTNNYDDKFNWFVAEKLIFNSECLSAILKISVFIGDDCVGK